MDYRHRDDRPYSNLMLAARITLPHFSVSSAMKFSNSAGAIDIGTAPKSASRDLNFGSARVALVSLLSLSMIPAGVLFGAPMPYQPMASYPGTNSATVGMAGSASERVVVVTARARSSPLRIYPIK